jgi:O-antigen/teichoic acid export membrane protein
LFWTEFDSGLLREQARYSVPLGLSGIAATIQNNLHMFFVANRFSAAEFAVYSVGCVQLPLTSLLWESVNAVLLPRISELQRQGKDRDIAVLLSSAMRKLGFVHLPIFWLFTIIGYDFLTFLYTKRYAGSWPIFLVNLVFIPISLLIVDPVLRAYAGQVPFLVKSRIVSTMLMVPAVVVGIRFGMPGVLAAVAVVILAERLVLMYRITRVLRMNRHDIRLFADVGKLALASFIAAAVTALVRQMLPAMHTLAVLVIAAMVFCSVYVGAVFLLRIATASETEMLRSKLIHVGRVLKLA